MGNRLQEYRQRLGLTQEDLGALMGVGPGQISRLESGARNFDVTWAMRAAPYLKCWYLELLDDPEVPSGVPIRWKLTSSVYIQESATKEMTRPMTALLGSSAAIVEGGFWLPEYDDGDILFLDAESSPAETSRDAFVKLRSKAVLFGRLTPSLLAGRFHFSSHRMPKILPDQEVEWVANVRYVQRRY
jgi:transcriptional regulator with XRE-family HTH domain